MICKEPSKVLGSVTLSLENDGVGKRTGTDVTRNDGSGLGNLHTRLSAIGGELRAEALPGGRFRMEAVAPLRPPPQEHRLM